MRKASLLIIALAMSMTLTSSTAETVQWAASAEASSAYGQSPTPDGIAQAIAFYLAGPAEGLVGPVLSLVDLLGPAVGPALEVVLCTVFSQAPCVPEDPGQLVDDTVAGASTIPGNTPGFLAGLPDTLIPALMGLPDDAVGTVLGLPAAIEAAQKGGAWSKEQATGAPDTYPNCGDIGTAWAPQTSGSDPEWIKLSYSPPVANATRIDIYETNIGSFVTSVDITLGDGSTQTVFTGPDSTPCAGILSINLTGSPTVAAVKVNTQAAGWEEIDAVGVAS